MSSVGNGVGGVGLLSHEKCFVYLSSLLFSSRRFDLVLFAFVQILGY